MLALIDGHTWTYICCNIDFSEEGYSNLRELVQYAHPFFQAVYF